MNKQTIDKMRKATVEQNNRLRRLQCFPAVQQEFELEYQIARELAEARRDAGLSQAQIATIMGTTQSAVSRIERGANVSVETIARYAKACGKHLEVHIA